MQIVEKIIRTYTYGFVLDYKHWKTKIIINAERLKLF